MKLVFSYAMLCLGSIILIFVSLKTVQRLILICKYYEGIRMCFLLFFGILILMVGLYFIGN